MEGKKLAKLCAKYADDKKAEEIVILDVTGLSPVTDYFVICTATSAPHLRAVRREIDDQLSKEHGQHARFTDDAFESGWVILDYGDVMVHIFHQEKRDFYSLEDLWGDAPILK
jgi:ribosome-associated protein